MAAKAGPSTSRLHAVFQAELRMAPGAWLGNLRIEKVCDWLARGNLPIAGAMLRRGNLHRWQAMTVPASSSIMTRAAGLLFAVGALVSWTCYAVGNRRWLERLDHLSAHDWNLLTGVVTGLQSLILVPFAVDIVNAHSVAG